MTEVVGGEPERTGVQPKDEVPHHSGAKGWTQSGSPAWKRFALLLTDEPLWSCIFKSPAIGNPILKKKKKNLLTSVWLFLTLKNKSKTWAKVLSIYVLQSTKDSFQNTRSNSQRVIRWNPRGASWQLVCMRMNMTKSQSKTSNSDATVCRQACIIDSFLFLISDMRVWL